MANGPNVKLPPVPFRTWTVFCRGGHVYIEIDEVNEIATSVHQSAVRLSVTEAKDVIRHIETSIALIERETGVL